MPEDHMAIEHIAIGIEDDFHSFIDEEDYPELTRRFDALMGDLQEILKKYRHRILVDEDCNPIRRLDRWERRSTHTGWSPSGAATWVTGASTSSA